MNENLVVNHRSTVTQIAALVISIVICFVAAAAGGLATSAGLESWYATLEKPTWNPPNWIFGPVWSFLYLTMAISAWLVWRKSGFDTARVALSWFAFHLLLNVLWSYLFFGLQLPGWAVIELVMLWASIVIAMRLFSKHSTLAAWMLAPYLAWVAFAGFLNFTIWSLNKG